jgi:hypothetical protein
MRFFKSIGSSDFLSGFLVVLYLFHQWFILIVQIFTLLNVALSTTSFESIIVAQCTMLLLIDVICYLSY